MNPMHRLERIFDYTLLTIPVVIDVVDGSAVQGMQP